MPCLATCCRRIRSSCDYDVTSDHHDDDQQGLSSIRRLEQSKKFRHHDMPSVDCKANSDSDSTGRIIKRHKIRRINLNDCWHQRLDRARIRELPVPLAVTVAHGHHAGPISGGITGSWISMNDQAASNLVEQTCGVQFGRTL